MEQEPMNKSIQPACDYPKPTGWACTREQGHDGPCAAVKVPPLQTYKIRSSTIMMANFHYTEMEETFKKYALWSRRMARLSRMFRLWSIDRYFIHCAIHFESEAKEARSHIV